MGLPDQFGRALVGGNAQDQGGILMLGRNGGFGSAGGESGVTFVAPKSVNLTNPLRTGLQLYDIGGDRRDIEVCPIDVPGPDYLAPATLAGRALPRCGGELRAGYLRQPTLADVYADADGHQ